MESRGVELGIERPVRVARRALPRPLPFHVVTVAGTNGKGSSVALLEAVFAAAGHRVGAYTSPALLGFEETLRVGAVPVAPSAWVAAFEAIELAARGEALTAFELQTLAAVRALVDAGVSVALLEVGLGGRRDAVNAFDPDLVLLTTIDRDHDAWLGTSRESVAREKAGVLRPGVDAVCADGHPPGSLLEEGHRLGVDWRLRGRDFHVASGASSWGFRGRSRILDRLPRPAIPGECQLDNAAGVVACLEVLGSRFAVSDEALCRGLEGVRLAGRQQAFPGPVSRLVDVAHNPQAARALGAALDGAPVAGRTIAALGMLADKDVGGTAGALGPRVAAWHLGSLAGPRGLCAQGLSDRLAEAGVGPAAGLHGSAEEAYQAAMAEARPGDRVVAFGSFLMAGAALRVESAGPLAGH